MIRRNLLHIFCSQWEVFYGICSRQTLEILEVNKFVHSLTFENHLANILSGRPFRSQRVLVSNRSL